MKTHKTIKLSRFAGVLLLGFALSNCGSSQDVLSELGVQNNEQLSELESAYGDGDFSQYAGSYNLTSSGTLSFSGQCDIDLAHYLLHNDGDPRGGVILSANEVLALQNRGIRYGAGGDLTIFDEPAIVFGDPGRLALKISDIFKVSGATQTDGSFTFVAGEILALDRYAVFVMRGQILDVDGVKMIKGRLEMNLHGEFEGGFVDSSGTTSYNHCRVVSSEEIVFERVN
ncbi:MAG: hypothetical protein KDD48_08980 [Bdellovibrionales bacterium]|nr:hypothetical protein [Bdellovibrionales bacterium]